MSSRSRLLVPALAAIVALLMVSGAESQIVRDQRRLESGVDLVMVTATVLDAEGHLVPDLSTDAFAIWEDGVQQQIMRFNMPFGRVGAVVYLVLGTMFALLGAFAT